MELSYISRNPKKLIFEEATFRAQKMKKTALEKCLTFREMELSSPKLTKLLMFQKELTGPENQAKNLPDEISFLL